MNTVQAPGLAPPHPLAAPPAAAPGAMLPVPYRVGSARTENRDTATLVLEPLDAGHALGPWRPGQFTMVYAFGIGEIPISVSGDPDRPDRLVHTVRDVGAVSHAIARTGPGGVLGVRGPFGRGWADCLEPDDAGTAPGPAGHGDALLAAGDDLVIAAGGLGLAPVRPLVYAAARERRRYGRVHLVVGARSPDELLYTGEFEAWRARGVEVTVTVDRGGPAWSGRVGLVTEPLARLALDPARTTAFLCGPEVMMTACARLLCERGVPDDRIALSLERSMKCGVGVCGHCQLGPDLLCRDGPCVSYRHAAPLLAVKEL